ncbi:MAG: phospholipid carrier-dependent glycosyltransferase [Planctomycetota bacterium]
MSPFVRPKAIRRGDRLLARGVFWIVLAIYSATMSGLPDNPDAEVEFQTTSALARTSGLALEGTPEARGIIALPNGRGGTGFDVKEGVGERAGKHYSWFGIGQAVVGVPFYAVGAGLARVFPDVQAAHARRTAYGVERSEYFQHLVVGWRNPLLGALTAWLFVFAARRLGASRSAAAVGAFGLSLCTFAWPQARSTLSDVQATFFLFFAFHLLLRFRESFVRTRRIHVAEQLLFGGALGLAFLTRAVTAPAVAVLAVGYAVVVWRGRRRAGSGTRAWLDLAIGYAPALLLFGAFLLVNQLRFGAPLESGYGEAVGPQYFDAQRIPRGLVGLLAAPGRGLLWLAPGTLVAVVGLWWSWGRGERLWPLTLILLAAAILVPPAATVGWGGGWTFGPRYALPLLPVLWLGVALAWDVVRARKLRWTVAGPILLGLVPNLGAVLVDQMTHQDLAVQAARIAWPDAHVYTEEEKQAEATAAAEWARFQRIEWDWRFAAPWAHWRILRHRIAMGDELFGVRELFFLDHPAVLEPMGERSRGWNHFAWYDLAVNLQGTLWPVALALLAALVGGLVQLVRGFDATLR